MGMAGLYNWLDINVETPAAQKFIKCRALTLFFTLHWHSHFDASFLCIVGIDAHVSVLKTLGIQTHSQFWFVFRYLCLKESGIYVQGNKVMDVRFRISRGTYNIP